MESKYSFKKYVSFSAIILSDFYTNFFTDFLGKINKCFKKFERILPKTIQPSLKTLHILTNDRKILFSALHNSFKIFFGKI